MDQRRIPWGSALPGANGITGANAWSTADKDEYFRLHELTERAEDEWAAEADVLMRKNRGRYRNEWSNADSDAFDRGLIKRARAYDPLNRFYVEMEEKYKDVRAKKKSVAEAAAIVYKDTFADPYAPPRPLPDGTVLPGSKGYNEAKASFGKGRTRRRRRKSRRTRKR